MKLKKGSAAAKAFMAKLRAKRATKSKVKPKPSRIDDLLLLDEIKGRQKKIGAAKKDYIAVYKKGNEQKIISVKAIDKDKAIFEAESQKGYNKLNSYDLIDIYETTAKKIGSTLKLNPKEKRLGAVDKDLQTRAKTYHKDTKRHNVNIRVVSGINGIIISDIKLKYDSLTKWNKVLENLNTELKKETNKGYKAAIKVDIFRVKNIIKLF